MQVYNLFFYPEFVFRHQLEVSRLSTAKWIIVIFPYILIYWELKPYASIMSMDGTLWNLMHLLSIIYQQEWFTHLRTILHRSCIATPTTVAPLQGMGTCLQEVFVVYAIVIFLNQVARLEAILTQGLNMLLAVSLNECSGTLLVIILRLEQTFHLPTILHSRDFPDFQHTIILTLRQYLWVTNPLVVI